LRLGGLLWYVWYDPWRGCLPPWASPSCHNCGCRLCVKFNKGMWKMKMPEVRALGESQALARVEVPKLLAKLPTIAEVLVQPAWDGDTAKGERGLFVFVSSTLVKLLLKVEHPALKLMVSGRTWDEAWAALEAVLKQDDVPWEQDTPREEKVQKKRR